MIDDFGFPHPVGCIDTKEVAPSDPISATYTRLITAYEFFNHRLFAERLPYRLITLQRRSGTFGYFAGDRFGTRDRTAIADEIAMNPVYLREHRLEEVLQTLTHEMVHCEQRHFGKPSRAGYHNKEFAAMMRRVGLVTSTTGLPSGNPTGIASLVSTLRATAVALEGSSGG